MVELNDAITFITFIGGFFVLALYVQMWRYFVKMWYKRFKYGKGY